MAWERNVPPHGVNHATRKGIKHRPEKRRTSGPMPPNLKKGGSMDQQTIDNNFKYHAPKDGQPEVYQQIRDKAKELVILINSVSPECREKSLAITNIEQAVFWANAGIARS
jgi:hypothetical protein